MAKFLDKKERVYDLKLTSYGHYLLSIGTFKPIYYAFYDDNILYDGAYGALTESQNYVHKRVKEETPYFEGLTLFRDIELNLNSSPSENGIFDVDITPIKIEPAADNFKINKMIGDAYLDGQTNKAPAWKVVSLQGRISSSNQVDPVFSSSIPQVNVTLRYSLETKEAENFIDPQNVGEIENRTPMFFDREVIRLKNEHALFYIDENNTELLTKNYDIEVFVITSSNGTSSLERKYFEYEMPQVKDGLMVSSTPQTTIATSYTTNSVEYYFDVLTDMRVNQLQACKGAEVFNRQSYYIDLDFECDQEKPQNFEVDIYGAVTEPEICLD